MRRNRMVCNDCHGKIFYHSITFHNNKFHSKDED
jgi:hypothetical protein